MKKYFFLNLIAIKSSEASGALHLSVNHQSAEKNSMSKNKSVINIDDPVLFKSK